MNEQINISGSVGKGYRIKGQSYLHHNEYFLQSSISIFGFTLFWFTFLGPYETLSEANKGLEDWTCKKITTMYQYNENI